MSLYTIKFDIFTFALKPFVVPLCTYIIHLFSEDCKPVEFEHKKRAANSSF